jgi:cell division protein FtsL
MVRLNLLLLLSIIASALALITSQHQARKLYSELQVEQAAAKRFEEEIARLQVEQSSWSTPSRIEKVARERLGMRIPDASRTRVLVPDPAESGLRPGSGAVSVR